MPGLGLLPAVLGPVVSLLDPLSPCWVLFFRHLVNTKNLLRLIVLS